MTELSNPLLHLPKKCTVHTIFLICFSFQVRIQFYNTISSLPAKLLKSVIGLLWILFSMSPLLSQFILSPQVYWKAKIGSNRKYLSNGMWKFLKQEREQNIAYLNIFVRLSHVTIINAEQFENLLKHVSIETHSFQLYIFSNLKEVIRNYIYSSVVKIVS